MSALNIFKALVVFATTALVARNVSPHEFGLISFALPLMAFLTLLTDLGIASAIVRQQVLTAGAAGGAFKVLVLMGSIGGLVMGVGAASAERWFELPGLSGVMRGFAVVACLSIYAVVPRAMLERELRYTKIAQVEFLAIIFGLLLFGVFLTLLGGVAALVAFHLGLQLTRVVWFFVIVRSSLDVGGPIGSAAEMISFGALNLLSNLLSFAARNLDRFILARTLGAAALGLYGFAYQFMIVPLMVLAWPISGVLLATLSRVQKNVEMQRKLVLAVSGATSFLVFLAAALLMLLLEYPLNHLYGAKWAGLAVVIAILAPAGAVQSLAVYAGSYFVAGGRVGVNLMFAAFHAANTVIAFWLFSGYGLVACVLAYAVGSFLVSASMIFVMCRMAGLQFLAYLQEISSGIVALVLSSLFVFPIRFAGADDFLAWIASCAVFAIVCVVVGFFAWQSLMRNVRVLKEARLGGLSAD